VSREGDEVGISIRARMWRYSSSCRSVTSVTRKPLLGTAVTRPSLRRSSIASRTGVAETPKRAARAGAEWISPGGTAAGFYVINLRKTGFLDTPPGACRPKVMPKGGTPTSWIPPRVFLLR
jgi:hypothetical protein